MARIAGVDLPRDKRVEIGLTYIYGIGRKLSNDILKTANVNPDTRVRDLTDDEISRLREAIDHGYTVEGDLRRDVALDIKRLIEIGSYRDTEEAFRSAASARKPTRAPAKARRRPSPTRSSNRRAKQ